MIKKIFALFFIFLLVVIPKTSMAIGNQKAAAIGEIYLGKHGLVRDYSSKNNEAKAYGEIYSGGNKDNGASPAAIGVALATIKTNTFKGEYLILDYSVVATIPTMLSSTCVMTLTNEDTGALLSTTPLKASSKDPTMNLGTSVTMWVGSSTKNVKVSMSSATVTCTDGKTYNLIPYQSYVAKRN